MDLSRGQDKLLTEQIFVAFDTETTGLDAAFHRIVEIGAVKFVPGSPGGETFQTLVNPDRPMPPEVIPIHGITDEMVAAAPKVAEALTRFSTFCGTDTILVAHNAPFDLSFVACELDRTGIELEDLPVLDTVEITRACFRSKDSYSLESLTKSLQLAPSQEHRALADAQLVKSLFERCVTKLTNVKLVADLLARFQVEHASHYSLKVLDLPPEFTDFQTAVEGKLRLQILYEGSKGVAERRVIRPYLIHERDSSLYVTAFCEKANADRTFRFDRIIDFRLIKSDC